MPSNLLYAALNSMQLSSRSQTDERWPTFEEILKGLHSQGIYVHSEQLAEFLLAHGLPVDLRYVPSHLRGKALEVNQNYQGDLVEVIEELEQPSWDFSWMQEIQLSSNLENEQSMLLMEAQEQPAWDYSWFH